MTPLDGRWAWLNPYATLPDDQLIARARQCAGVVVKVGMWREFDLLRAAGVRLGIERYAYPDKPVIEAGYLQEGVLRGAEFAVVDAEVEWEPTDGSAMRALCGAFAQLCPGTPLYGCTDTRGGRMDLPYQRVLRQNIAGWVPMIYPQAFQQTVARSFAAALSSGQDFGGLPVLPAIQTYDAVGAQMVIDQLAEVSARGLPGCSAYTVAHAAAEEWAAFISGQEGQPMTPQERQEFDALRQQVADIAARLATAKTFIAIGADALNGDAAPQQEKDEAKGLLGCQ